jgi:hypothetical protein
MLGIVTGNRDAECEFGRTKGGNVPARLEISFETIGLVNGGGCGDDVVDMESEYGRPSLGDMMVNAPLIFHLLKAPTCDHVMECFVPDLAGLLHAIDTFV